MPNYIELGEAVVKASPEASELLKSAGRALADEATSLLHLGPDAKGVSELSDSASGYLDTMGITAGRPASLNGNVGEVVSSRAADFDSVFGERTNFDEGYDRLLHEHRMEVQTRFQERDRITQTQPTERQMRQ